MTTALSRVQSLMQEVGPALPEIDIVIQEDDDHWIIQWDDGLRFEVGYCDKPSRLMLSSTIGAPYADRLSEMQITALCANHLFAEDHALRVALSHPGGEFMLISEQVLEACFLGPLCDTLSHYAQRTRYFTELIASRDELLHVTGLPALAGWTA